MHDAVMTYAITEGGLLRRIERRLGITRGDPHDWRRRAVLFVVIGYVSMLLLALGGRMATGEWPHGLLQLPTHFRMLVSIPLLFAAEPLVDARAIAATAYLIESRLIGAGATDAYREALARTIRLRDSYAIELAMFACVIASLVVTRTFEPAGSLFAWINVVTVVMLRFLILRWLWRWALWALFVWRVSRLKLSLRATHPDRLGGVGPLLGPAYAFAAVVAAGSAGLAGAWMHRLVTENVALTTITQVTGVYAAIAVLVALAPTLSLIGPLYRARKDGLGRYGAFAHRYAYAFEARWYDADGKEALGTPDLQSLADLGNSYDVVAEMRVLPWYRRLIIAVVAGAVAPILPLVIAQTGVTAIVQRIGKMLL
jgi:hypothetical protein